MSGAAIDSGLVLFYGAAAILVILLLALIVPGKW